MSDETSPTNRRQFIRTTAAAGVAGSAAYGLSRFASRQRQPVVILKVADYAARLRDDVRRGLQELGVERDAIRGRSVVIKPNLVEPHREASHINVHPLLIGAVVECFRSMDAASVTVAEGAGHVHDSYHVLHTSGLIEVLADTKTPFVDLNFSDVVPVKNVSGETKLAKLMLPKPVVDADVFVSLAKMKTHHWAGATLSMKNLFGIMPGSYYGWPKNVLHQNGIGQSIVDINASLLAVRNQKRHLCIVDGIIGMEGDGPIMGTPKEAGVLVFGDNPVATDATCCRVMGINPKLIEHVVAASRKFGPMRAAALDQRGETVASVETHFQLLEHIPAHKRILEG